MAKTNRTSPALSNAQTIAMFANWITLNPTENFAPVLSAIYGVMPKQPEQGYAEAPKVPMLHKAQELVQGARQSDYGDKLQNFTQIAMLFQGVLAMKLQAQACITPEDVAMLMMQVKLARLAKSPDHFDSIMDVAGYAACFSILQDERAAGKALPGALVDPRS